MNVLDKSDFIALMGEDPEDMFGPDWENIVQALEEEMGH